MKLDNAEGHSLSDSTSQHHLYETDSTELEEFEGPDLDSDADEVEATLLRESNAHPPEYYINRLKNLDISEFIKEDYRLGIIDLLDRIEELWI
jgi:hypothetical protein